MISTSVLGMTSGNSGAPSNIWVIIGAHNTLVITPETRMARGNRGAPVRSIKRTKNIVLVDILGIKSNVTGQVDETDDEDRDEVGQERLLDDRDQHRSVLKLFGQPAERSEPADQQCDRQQCLFLKKHISLHAVVIVACLSLQTGSSAS